MVAYHRADIKCLYYIVLIVYTSHVVVNTEMVNDDKRNVLINVE